MAYWHNTLTQIVTKPLTSPSKLTHQHGHWRCEEEEEDGRGEGAYKKFAAELHGGKSVNIPLSLLSLCSSPLSILRCFHAFAILSFMAMKTFLLLRRIGKEA